MPSPFPGMNPYLENPELWSEVHSRLIVAIADEIAAPLRPQYYVAIEKRTYLNEPEEGVLVGIPDVSVFSKHRPSPSVPEIQSGGVATLASPQEPLTVTLPVPEEVHENYLEVREIQTGAVITAIEILSPKNKRSGEGRHAYLRKRQQVLASLTHLVEIDLLRAGTSMPIQGAEVATDYRILISRSKGRPTAQLYAFNLQNPIPVFPVPLKQGDVEPLVDLKPILEGIYDRAGFDLRIDYDQLPQSGLSEEQVNWVTSVLSSSNQVEGSTV
ncbi:MAG: DUF4058 family protein [Leptolyngbyaceae bacterium]|nr:DUF4058 family protein [Leptolyngbyaceae bacterium]